MNRGGNAVLSMVVLVSLGAIKQSVISPMHAETSSRHALLATVEESRDARYALLVGIEKYPQSWHGLPGPSTDVSEVRALLTDVYGFSSENILELPDSMATREAIIAGFRSHLARAGSAGTAVFYYSGHGLLLDRNYSKPDRETGGPDQALYVWNRSGRGTVLLDDELGLLIRELRAERVLIIVDACYSGTMQKRVGDWYPGAIERNLNFSEVRPYLDFPVTFLTYTPPASHTLQIERIWGSRRVFMAASRDRQLAYSRRNWPKHRESHGIFTYYLVRRLTSADPKDTFRSILSKTREDLQAGFCRSCQTPQISGGGEMKHPNEILR